MPKIFRSEYLHSYNYYTFGYAPYAERIGDESIDPIYDMGFLPYSGDLRSEVSNLYYMARSARVDLATFSLSSENRRIKKKFEETHFSVEQFPASDFAENQAMIDFCMAYFKERHGEHVMSQERLKRILRYNPETMVLEYKDEQGIVRAYVIEIQGTEISHYWFSFYDVGLVHSSFGMWLMLDRTEHAKEQRLKHYYLGTVYGEKALYKTNIPALEYWNGTEWLRDVTQLKNRARTDEARVVDIADEFKQ